MNQESTTTSKFRFCLPPPFHRKPPKSSALSLSQNILLFLSCSRSSLPNKPVSVLQNFYSVCRRQSNNSRHCISKLCIRENRAENWVLTWKLFVESGVLWEGSIEIYFPRYMYLKVSYSLKQGKKNITKENFLGRSVLLFDKAFRYGKTFLLSDYQVDIWSYYCVIEVKNGCSFLQLAHTSQVPRSSWRSLWACECALLWVEWCGKASRRCFSRRSRFSLVLINPFSVIWNGERKFLHSLWCCFRV